MSGDEILNMNMHGIGMYVVFWILMHVQMEEE